MTDRKRLGNWGEEAAAQYLSALGYRILARNWHCRYGELDIVAETDRLLALVEVKTRESDCFRPAREAVDFRKRRKLVRAGLAWLAAHPEEERPVRFDVAEVYPGPDGQAMITYLEDAFEPEEGKHQWT